MAGFAQNQYHKLHEGSQVPNPPSMLEKLEIQGHILTLDKAAARYLLDGQEASAEENLALIFLFAAARNGHLCVRQTETLLPSLAQLWPIEDLDFLTECQLKIIEGFKKLSASCKKIIRRGAYFYLPKNAYYENEIKRYFDQINQDTPSLPIEPNNFINKNLTDEQQLAIQKSLGFSLSFITGGPGVGKTFTACQIIASFFNAFPNAKVAIGAPTGKAIANLQEYLARSFDMEKYQVQFFTLHRLFHQKIHSYLPYDLILIDESSMIDVTFFLQLFQYYKPHSRLIFLGDPNQLPPIGSGFIFNDLLAMTSQKSNLTKCHRTEIREILHCANAVKEGNLSLFLDTAGRRFYDLPNKADLIKHILNQIPPIEKTDSHYQKLVTLQKYKVLTALKKGEYGADSLNQAIKFQLSSSSFHPILITTNDYRLELFNGDLGILINFNEAIFFARNTQQSYYLENDRVRKIPAALLPHYELAYCLSIHKSQGSEYDKVSVILPPSSEVFGRELLYTALTRSKVDFEIFSDSTTLTQLIKNRCVRTSGLVQK